MIAALAIILLHAIVLVGFIKWQERKHKKGLQSS